MQECLFVGCGCAILEGEGGKGRKEMKCNILLQENPTRMIIPSKYCLATTIVLFFLSGPHIIQLVPGRKKQSGIISRESNDVRYTA